MKIFKDYQEIMNQPFKATFKEKLFALATILVTLAILAYLPLLKFTDVDKSLVHLIPVVAFLLFVIALKFAYPDTMERNAERDALFYKKHISRMDAKERKHAEAQAEEQTIKGKIKGLNKYSAALSVFTFFLGQLLPVKVLAFLALVILITGYFYVVGTEQFAKEKFYRTLKKFGK